MNDGIMDNNSEACVLVEVSIVMPCLNEEQTVGICVRRAIEAFRSNGIDGEVIVVDNGSTDSSIERAMKAGASVIVENKRGYGYAYQRGIREAKGRYIIIGDADNTYDFSLITFFVQKLREGYAFVNGNRFGGIIEYGAMPALHRYFGNPLLTAAFNIFFKSGFNDVYCGMKAFSRDAYDIIRPISTGMEFALELSINSSRADLKRIEIPVGLTRRQGMSKLRPLQDGWRSVSFMLMYCPNYLYLLPGIMLFCIGIFGMLVLLNGPLRLFGHTFDFHAMICATMMVLLGFQVINLGLFAKGYAISHGYERKNSFFLTFYKYFNLERGILLGFLLVLVGVALAFDILRKWFFIGVPITQARQELLAFMMILIGVQTIFSSFLISLMSLRSSRT